MITAVPLLFEVRHFPNTLVACRLWILCFSAISAVTWYIQVKREGLIEDMERIQIGKSLAEGRTPQELAMEGLTAAVDPKVLK